MQFDKIIKIAESFQFEIGEKEKSFWEINS